MSIALTNRLSLITPALWGVISYGELCPASRPVTGIQNKTVTFNSPLQGQLLDGALLALWHKSPNADPSIEECSSRSRNHGVWGGTLWIANDLVLMEACDRANPAKQGQPGRSLRYALEPPNSDLLNNQVSMLNVDV